MAFVTEGRLWSINVDQGGGAIGPPRPIADDQPESPSWEGDSRHIVYQTPNGLRRILADGSLPHPIALDLTGKAAPPPGRIGVPARACSSRAIRSTVLASFTPAACP